MPYVQSSVMTYVDYDEEAAELDIRFVSGKVYRYFGVPLATYVDLLEAESHGEFFNQHIKDVFRCIEVQPRQR
jgi:KTSC domain